MVPISTRRDRLASAAPPGMQDGGLLSDTERQGPFGRMSRLFRRRKRAFFVGMVVCELFYVFVSVPFRIGFLFDPHASKDWRTQWTTELTVLTILDVLADVAGFASLKDIFDARRREQASQAAHAMGSIGTRRQKSVRGPMKQGSSTVLPKLRDSLQVVWSLNSILPGKHGSHAVEKPLLLEMVSMLPLELLALALGPNSLHILRVLKLLRLYRFPGCLKEVKQMNTGSSIVQMLEHTGNVLLLNTIMVGLGCCHWIACGYMTVAHFECGIDFTHCSKALSLLHGVTASTHDAHGTSHESAAATGSAVSPTGDGSGYTCWAIDDFLVGTSLTRQYGRAVYWASRSITTTGMYDVGATTDIETIYAIFVQVISAVFTTAVLATFLFIFRHRNARTQEFMEHVDNAKEYMKMRHFPEAVREGVLGYYKNAWATHHALHHGEVVERLPGHLRVSVYSILKAQRIQNVGFLSKMSIEFINTLALHIEHCVYSPKDWVIEKLPDGMYFVLRGTVRVDGPSHPQGRIAKTGDHFAEGCLLFPGKSDERARAQTYCDLYKLPQREFNRTLKIFYRDNAQEHLENMRSVLARHDQQEQKMKRMLGRAQDSAATSSNPMNSGGRRSVSFITGGGAPLKQQRPPWRMPGSVFRRRWEYARLVSLVFVAFEVPLYVVFEAITFPFGAHSAYSVRSILSIFVEIFFVADFIFRARFFAYIDQLALIPVTDPGYIFDAYRQNGFWLDVVAIVPVPLVVEFIVSRGQHWTVWLHASRVVRLVRTHYIPHTMQEVAHIRGLSSKAQEAATMLLYVTLTLHVTGCLWFLMARFSIHEDEFEHIDDGFTRDRCLQDAGHHGNCSWALYDAYGQIGTSFVVQDPEHSIYTIDMAYLRSLYWSIVALTTVGYGDIVAYSTLESYFAACWVFVGAIINYGVVGAMSSIISSYTASSHHHSEKMNTINVTLGHFRISESIRARIRQFYHQQLYVQKVTSEAQLLSGLPNSLRHRISTILHADSVRKVPLFVDAQNERLLYELTGLFRRQLYQRGDPFFAEGTLCEEMYVVVNGRANIFCKRVGTVPVGALSAGDVFGVCELLLQKSFNTTVIAASVVDVSVITYKSFVATIERHFSAEMEALRIQATQQHIFDTLTLEAVIDNIKSRSTLVKFTDKCTSMFEEKENWAHERNKMQFRLYWDLIILLLDIYNGFQVTFRIGFLSHPASSARLALVVSDFVGDAFLLADIYLKFYYFECEEVGLRNLISREERSSTYAMHELRRDFMSSLPLYYVGSSFLAMSLCRLPRLLRIRQVPEMIDSLIMRLQQRFSTGGNISAYLSPIKLVFILIFAGHFAACILYLICHTDHNPKNWTHHDPIVHMEHESVGVLYLRAFYWALTTLTLVGSREIVPLAVPGTLWATLTCLCCAFIVGHIIGELSELVLEMDKTKKEFKEHESHFDEFAKDHNLPGSIRTRVFHYLKFQHTYFKGVDVYHTFSDLSPNLRVQLMMDLHGPTLQNLCIAPYLSQNQINGLAVRLKSELYIPGDTIIVEGDLGHKVYIVKAGTGMVLWKSTGTAVATLTAGSLFGEVAFFLRGQRRIASVQATTCSEILVLGRRAWEELLASSPREEAEATERELIHWVQYCLKGYNLMTVEIVKNIKSGGGDTNTKPLPIEELRVLNGMTGARENIHLPNTFKRSSNSALEERKVRQILKKAARHGGNSAEAEFSASPNILVLVFQWMQNNLLPGGRKSARHIRVYADTTCDDSIANDEENSDSVTMPSFSTDGRHGQKQMSAPLTLLKMRSFKNGTAVQINPVSSSMREYYHDEQLLEMEEECWRRYKVSLFMAESFVAAATVPPPQATQSQILPQIQLGQQTPGRQSYVGTARGEEETPTTSQAARNIRVTRKTFCGATMPGVGPSRTTRTVTTDGMRFLANYESRNRPSERGLRQKQRTHGSSGRSHDRAGVHESFGPSHMRSGAARAHRRQRKLKRSQSLPLFDRHFAAMICEELQESNAKESEGKLNLGFELLQRCRQPEFSSLFQFYLAWLKRKERWRHFWKKQVSRLPWYSHLSTSLRSLRSYSAKTESSPFLQEFGGNGDAEIFSKTLLHGGGSAVTTSKAEDFVEFLSRCYRFWEWIMVAVGIFYAVTMPFFVCFSSDEVTHSEDDTNDTSFAHWERIVIFADIICIVNFTLKHSALHHVLELSAGGDADVPVDTKPSPPAAKQPVFSTKGSSRSLTTPAPQQRPKKNHPIRRWWRHHVNTSACIEVIASLPLDLLLYIPPLSTSALQDYPWFYMSLLQLNKIPLILESIEASERLTQILGDDLGLPLDESRLHFIRTVILYVLSGHWIGCLWFRAGLYAYHLYGESWLSTSKMLSVDGFGELSEIPTSRRYVRSLHFGIGSITTVFYGDVVSMNVVETVVEIAFIVLCILIFGALVGAQFELIQANYKHKMLFEQNLMELYHFLKNNDVPRDVRQRLRLYYTNTWLKYHGHDDLEGVRGLSTLLVEDIAQYTLRDFANKVSILKSCDESFLRSLLTCLKHIICSSSEPVVRKGDVDRSMYFIARGKVLVQGPGFELVKHEGDFFGELSLLYGIPRSATCSSLGVSLLYVLEWATYEKLLADYPEYREQNRREWVVVSTVLKTGESRFRSIIDIVAHMEKSNWVVVDEIIRKAKSLK